MVFFILHSKEENKINLNYKSIDCIDNSVLLENYEITSGTTVTYFPYPQ